MAALLLSLASALFIAVGIVVRQHSTNGVPADHAIGGAMATALARRPLWWAGTAVAIGGYVLQALALSKGSLLLVQPVLVSSLLFALPLSARLDHRRVTRSEWVWAVLLTAAIAVFVVVGNPRPGHARPPTLAWMAVAALGIPVV
ncbi:MAG: DMT family transporter, partial [Mycobacteriaceae bacterium]